MAPSNQKEYTCGTLSYTKLGLIHLFVGMLWGDFCYTLMEKLIPTLLPVLLRIHEASNLTIGLLVGSIPAALNFVLNSILSTASDRIRTRWGRRRPFLFFGTPFVTLFLILVGWSAPIGRALHRLLGASGSPNFTIIVVTGVLAVGFQLFTLFVSAIYYYIFADVVPPTHLGRFMSLFRLVGALAGIGFSRFILPLAEVQTYIPWIFTGIALGYMVCFSLVLLQVREGEYPPPPPIVKRSFTGVIRQYFRECFSIRFFVIYFVAMSLDRASTVCRTMFNLLYAKETLQISLLEYGKLMAAMSSVLLFLYIPLGYLVDKLHPLRTFMLGSALIVITNAVGFFYCRDYLSFCIISGMIILTYILQNASVMPLNMSIYPHNQFGQFASAGNCMRALVVIAANVGGGAFIDYFGYRYIFVWDFIFTFVSLLLLMKFYREWQKLGGSANYIPPTISSVPNEAKS